MIAKDVQTQSNALSLIPQQLREIRRNSSVASFSAGAQEQLRVLLGLTETAGQSVAKYKILGALSYDGMRARYGDVDKAHSETYRWIVEDLDSKALSSKYNAREQYLTWLSGGRGIFHISGKLGSGKSTLMKFLCKHPRTRNELLSWSGMSCLIRSSLPSVSVC